VVGCPWSKHRFYVGIFLAVNNPSIVSAHNCTTVSAKFCLFLVFWIQVSFMIYTTLSTFWACISSPSWVWHPPGVVRFLHCWTMFSPMLCSCGQAASIPMRTHMQHACHMEWIICQLTPPVFSPGTRWACGASLWQGLEPYDGQTDSQGRALLSPSSAVIRLWWTNWNLFWVHVCPTTGQSWKKKTPRERDYGGKWGCNLGSSL